MTDGLSRRALLGSGAALTSALAGCSFFGQSDSQDTVTPAPVPTIAERGTVDLDQPSDLTVAHWLTRPDELAGYAAMVSGFTDQYDGVGVREPSGAGASLTQRGLQRRVERGFPPGAWQSEPGGGLETLVRDDLLLDAGPAVWEREPVRTNLPDAVRALAGPDDETTVAVPWYGERLNNLFYNPSVLDSAGVDPTALDSPGALLDAMETVGNETEAAPLALRVTPPFTLARLFESVLVGQAGVERMRRIIRGEVGLPETRAISAAMETVADIRPFLAEAPGEQSPVEQVLSGAAAMTIAGDRVVGGPRAVTGFGNHPEADYGEDWDRTTLPGTEGVFQFNADAFVAPRNNQTPELSMAWLRYCATSDAQRRYSAAAGTVPLRTDVRGAGLPPYAREQFGAYRTASARVPSIIDGLVLPEAAYRTYLTAFYRFANEWNPQLTTDRLVPPLNT